MILAHINMRGITVIQFLAAAMAAGTGVAAFQFPGSNSLAVRSVRIRVPQMVMDDQFTNTTLDRAP